MVINNKFDLYFQAQNTKLRKEEDRTSDKLSYNTSPKRAKGG
jgi:hypothetical protein